MIATSLPDIRKERGNYSYYPITEQKRTLGQSGSMTGTPSGRQPVSRRSYPSLRGTEDRYYSSVSARGRRIGGSSVPGTAGGSVRRRNRGGDSEHRSRRRGITPTNALLWAVYIFAFGGALFNSVFKKSTAEITINHGHFASRPSYTVEEVPPEGTTPYDPNKHHELVTEGVSNTFTELELTESQLHSGKLIAVNKPEDLTADGKSSVVRLIDYMNDCYTLVGEGLLLNKEAVDAFNEMMTDYIGYAGVVDFMVYGTTDTYTGENSYCPRYFPESSTGYTVDLAVKTRDGVLVTYNGRDSQGWIGQHCTDYGFIVRYPEGGESQTGEEYCPWHLRYVGKVHAGIMNSKGICLEEYLRLINNYRYNTPYTYKLDGVTYKVYYVPAGEEDEAKIPTDCQSEISGTNTDGYIVTVWNEE